MIMTYEEFVEFEIEQTKKIHELTDELTDVRKSYVREHFPSDLFGVPVRIHNPFYNYYSDDTFLISKAEIYSKDKYILTLCPMEFGNSIVLSGIDISEIERV